MTGDWRMDRIGASLRSENPTVLRWLEAGFAVIGDVQFPPGYSVLLTDEPAVRPAEGHGPADGWTPTSAGSSWRQAPVVSFRHGPTRRSG
jgi:hypothetical protein